MKQEISVFAHAEYIMNVIPKGVLVTTKVGDKLDTMTIGWGTIGIQWNKPLFTIFVREHRHTFTMLDQNPEFTVNIPLDDSAKKILAYCGTKSGRDTDKFADLGLHAVEPSVISVPGIEELPLTLECRVVYKQAQNPADVPAEAKEQFYSDDIPGDYHTAYYGEIVAAYIIK